MFLPRALSTLSDAQTAIERLQEVREPDVLCLRQVFEAETNEHVTPIDASLDVAIRVENATFQWASTGESDEKLDAKISQETLVEPFALENLTIDIPRGRLVAIVGPVGSGKSSLLQGVSPPAGIWLTTAHWRDENDGKRNFRWPACVLPAEWCVIQH